MVGSQENVEHKVADPTPQKSEFDKTAKEAESHVRQELHGDHKPQGDKQTAGEGGEHHDGDAEKTFADRALREVHSLLHAAGGWFHPDGQKPEAGADKLKPGKEPDSIELISPFEQSKAGSRAASHADGKGESEAGDAKPAEESKGWFARARDWTTGAVHKIGDYFKDAADFVEHGFTKGTSIIKDTWATVLKSKDNQEDVHVVGHMSEGQTKEIMVKTNHDTRQLTDDEFRYKDKEGNTIVENRKTKEIIAQSADGKTVYERKADGTEIVRDESGETIRDKKAGTYTKIDNDGTVTKIELDKRQPEDQKVITEFDKGFAIVQKRTRFSWKETEGHEGDNIMFRDGVAHVHKHGIRSAVLQDGTTHVKDEKLGEVRVHDGKLEQLQADGTYKAIKEGDPVMEHIRKSDGGGWQIMGVDVGKDGNVKTGTGQEIKSSGDGVTLTGADGKGRSVHGTVHNDGTSEVVDGKGATTKMDPDHPDHLVERTDAGGHEIFNYDDEDHCFSLDSGVTFDGDLDETDLDFMNLILDEDGSIEFDDGTDLLDNSDEAREDAEEAAHCSVAEADQACARAASAIATGGCDYGDIANMKDALGDLDAALQCAMRVGNLDTAGKIIMQKAAVESILSSAEARAQVKAELLSRGIADPTAVAQAQQNIGTHTVFGVVEEEQRRRSQNSV